MQYNPLPEPKRKYTIYAIIDPRTDEVCYVGMTRRYEERQEEHKRARLNPSDDGIGLRRTKAFLQAMREEGFTPRFQVLEEITTVRKGARTRELYWYRRLKRQGASLQNNLPMPFPVD